MANIENINLTIPKSTYEIEYLFKLLEMCNNLKTIGNFIIQGNSDTNLLPKITVGTEESNDPSVYFEGKNLEKGCFLIGKLPLCFNTVNLKVNNTKYNTPTLTTIKDKFGEYLQVKYPFATYNQLSFGQLFSRLNNNIASLDHIGININNKLLLKTEYQKMKTIVAKSSYMSEYPDNFEWPFVIPATIEEQKNKVENNIQRDPKFELVYNYQNTYPEIQIDIQTKLSPKNTIEMFPKPYGYYDANPKTGDYCVIVYVYTGWKSVSLRVDLRFYIPNFNSTKWLLEKNLRVKTN